MLFENRRLLRVTGNQREVFVVNEGDAFFVPTGTSNEVLTAVFNSPQDFFSSLPTYYEDQFIVSKVNPVDPQ